MPQESVNWVKKMLNYTVAGGKMNRGLSLMAVQQTLAASNGRTLSNKVLKFFHSYSLIIFACIRKDANPLL